MKVYCDKCKFIRSSSYAFGGVGWRCVRAKVIKRRDTPLQRVETKEDVEQKNADNHCVYYVPSNFLERLLYANTNG